MELRIRKPCGSRRKAPDRGAGSGARHEAWVVDLVAKHTTRGGDGGHLLSGPCEDGFRAGKVGHATQDHIAVGRADLDAKSDPVEHVRGGHGGAAAEERIEDDVAGVRERLQEELDQRPRKGSGV